MGGLGGYPPETKPRSGRARPISVGARGPRPFNNTVAAIFIKAGKEDLIQVRGIGEQKADELIASAIQAVKEAEAAAEAEEAHAEEEENSEEEESAEEIETDANPADSDDISDSVNEAKDTDDSTDPETAGDDKPAADSEGS